MAETLVIDEFHLTIYMPRRACASRTTEPSAGSSMAGASKPGSPKPPGRPVRRHPALKKTRIDLSR